MRRTATKVARLTPNTIQKTDEMDWAKASWRIAAPPDGEPARSAERSEANRLIWTAPRSETPMAPPRLRVKVARPEAIPISLRSTEFWNATIVAGIERAAQEEPAGQRKRECVNHVPLVAEARTQPLRREQRQERNDAEECGGAKNVDDGRCGDVPNPEQSRREHGLPRPSFREDETGQEQDAPREQGDLR